ncbi:peroxisome membrane protein, partial [Thamnocephalis sphaerospora]
QLLQRYEEFLLKNASQISSIESTLRTLTYILPGRFHDAELASESLFAGLKLLGLYHDALIVRALATRRHRVIDSSPATDISERPPADPLVQHNRYTRALWSTDGLTRRAAIALTVVKATEVTAEMLVRRRLGEEARWRLVLAIESIKALLRVLLLHQGGHRTLVTPPHPLRAVDPAAVEDAAQEAGVHPGYHRSNGHQSMPPTTTPIWTGRRCGKEVPQLATDDEVTDFLLGKVLRPEDVLGPLQLVRVQHGVHLLGEWITILRPVIYVVALRRFGLGAWRPWLLSLALELLARAASTAQRDGRSASTELEKSELSRRRRLLFLYLLRSPFYYTYTKGRLDGIRRWLSSKPLLSLIGGILGDYQPLWESIYF